MTQGSIAVEFAGQKVLVPKGGYYDRFRSTPDLDEVALDPAAGNIDWFRRIPKQARCRARRAARACHAGAARR